MRFHLKRPKAMFCATFINGNSNGFWNTITASRCSGAKPITDRPGKHLKPVDLEEVRTKAQDEIGVDLDDEDLAGYRIVQESLTNAAKHGDGTVVLDTEWDETGLTIRVVNPLTGETMEVEGPPLYGVYMLDMEEHTLRPIALPEEGFAFTDPVAEFTGEQAGGEGSESLALGLEDFP